MLDSKGGKFFNEASNEASNNKDNQTNQDYEVEAICYHAEFHLLCFR